MVPKTSSYRLTLGRKDIIAAFCTYREKHGSWHNLDRVLGTGKIGQKVLKQTIAFAKSRGDNEAAELGEVLLLLSRTQRKGLPTKVNTLRAQRVRPH